MTTNETPARRHPQGRPEPVTMTLNGHRLTFNPCPAGCSCQGTQPRELELTAAELIAEHTGRTEYLDG